MASYSTNYKVEGLDDLLKTLSGMSSQLQGNAMSKALRAGSKPVLAAARRTVPQRTGALKKSLGVKVSRKGYAVIGPRKGFKSKALDKIRAQHGENIEPANYAHLVELGTETAPPHPFLRPAFDATKEEAVQEIGKVLAAYFADGRIVAQAGKVHVGGGRFLGGE